MCPVCGIVAPFLHCGPCGSYQRIWGWALRLTWSSVPGPGHGADASTTSSRTVAQQWTEAARQAEQANLEVWQAGVSAGDGLLASGSSGEMAGQEDKGPKR